MSFNRFNRAKSLSRIQGNLDVTREINSITGGTISYSNGMTIHTFTSSDILSINQNYIVSYDTSIGYRTIGKIIAKNSIILEDLEYLVVAGGGGGGTTVGILSEGGLSVGGGAGGGGYLSSIPEESSGGGNSSLSKISYELPPVNGQLSIIVGAGGGTDSNGSDSAITSVGISTDLVRSTGGGTSGFDGGCGGAAQGWNNKPGLGGGRPSDVKGLGTATRTLLRTTAIGSTITATEVEQGFGGGGTTPPPLPAACSRRPDLLACQVYNMYAGGGGGAGENGTAGTISTSGRGGNGLQSSATGIATYYAGGGSGSLNEEPGLGGGGNVNTGGGGNVESPGGSGIVVIRYQTP